MLNPTIASDFRDYESEGLVVSVNTSGDEAVLMFERDGRDETVTATFTRDKARELGTDLMQWVGSPTTEAYDEYETVNGAGFEVNVSDGTTEFTAATDGLTMGFEPNYTQAVDIAQRLIAFAGADLRVATDA